MSWCHKHGGYMDTTQMIGCPDCEQIDTTRNEICIKCEGCESLTAENKWLLDVVEASAEYAKLAGPLLHGGPSHSVWRSQKRLLDAIHKLSQGPNPQKEGD